MKIIVIHAAPRKSDGNTHAVLEEFLKGASEAGADTDITYLVDKDISPCVGCFTCYADTPGECIHDDDMPGLTSKIREADMMILASPVYLDGMTSWAKIFFDRLVVFMDPHFREQDDGLVHPRRWEFPERFFLLSVCGYPGTFNFDPLVAHVKRICRNLHSDYCGALLRPAAFSILLGKKYPDRVAEVMAAVRAAGAQLVREGRVAEDILETAASDICTSKELMDTANAYWDRLLGAGARK